MEYTQSFRSCRLCPRQCKINRLHGERGFCGETATLRIASIGAHFGEEPPISGQQGSGTVFFSGCTLQWDFCQNYQISTSNLGDEMDVVEVVNELEALHTTQHIHNVNFVTPDHFFPHTVAIVEELRKRSIQFPIVYNMSGYERFESLQTLEPYADIYLPDFKYADKRLGEELSHCRDYPAVALDAISEMLKQKEVLDVFLTKNQSQIARQGVLVRHLILPGHTQNSLDALSTLFIEFGRKLPLSLMSQYHPVQSCDVPGLQRRITEEEFHQVYEHALALGFQHLFVQYLEDSESQHLKFLPDFTREKPFKGNET